MTQQVEIREGARRQHRSVAMLASLGCHFFDLDGMRINRDEIESLVGLKQFKGSRLDWLQEDFAEIFPFQWLQLSSNSSFDFIVVSTRPKEIESNESIRIGYLDYKKDPWHARDALRDTCLAPLVLQHVNGSELVLSSILNLLSHGQLSLLDVFGGREPRLAKCDTLLDLRSRYNVAKPSKYPKPEPRKLGM